MYTSLLALIALSVSPPAPPEQDPEDLQESRVIVPGEKVETVLPLGLFSDQLHTYTLDVPDDAILLRVDLRCPTADLDVELLRADWEGADTESSPSYSGLTTSGKETLIIDRMVEPRLRAGRYTIDVWYPGVELPIWKNRRLTQVEYSLEASIVVAREDAELQAGIAWTGTLDDASGRFRTFRIEVPDDAQVLRLDVLATTGDVDLYLRRRRPITRFSQANHAAVELYGRESLVIDRESEPPLRGGTWFVEAIEVNGYDTEPTEFTLRTDFERSLPPELTTIAPFGAADGESGRDRALPAIVEVFSGGGAGTGTMIGPGRILTNAHVVADQSLENATGEVVIGISRDPSLPSVATFRGAVVAFDAERDLALVEIRTGLYGQPLPEGFQFPVVEFGDPSRARMGDRLWTVGYPLAGGHRSRATLTMTTGIVAGFEKTSYGDLIKTDAKVIEGQSGGPALDAEGRVFAVATYVILGESDELAYLLPVSAIPAEWLE